MPFHRRSIFAIKWIILKTKPIHSNAHACTHKQRSVRLRRGQKTWVCSYEPFVNESFQFTFRFIWTHVRHLLFAQSLMLFHSPFAHTIQIINSIYHRCGLWKEQKNITTTITCKQGTNYRIATIVTASLLLPDYPPLQNDYLYPYFTFVYLDIANRKSADRLSEKK